MIKKLLKRPSVLFLLILGAFLIGRFIYMLPKFEEGLQAPDFPISVEATGDSIYLSSFKDTWVLLDFWGSWCPPCRKKHHALIEIYSTYGGPYHPASPAFEIVSIGVEKSADSWRRAIEKDRLIWPYHVLDVSESLRFFDSPVAVKYGVKQLPSSYLIDENREIIAVNPTIEELKTLLEAR